MNRWWWLFGVILVAGGGWVWASRPPAEAVARAQAAGPAIGRPAPDFTLTTLDGKSFTLSELRGTPVVLNFWATWCGPCQRELPALQATAQQYDGSVAVVGIDQGEPPETVQSYVDKLGLTFAIPMDSNFEVAHRYNVSGMPTTYFIDAEGVICHVWMGEMNRITLAEGIGQIWP
jgi:peroxiredoxin